MKKKSLILLAVITVFAIGGARASAFGGGSYGMHRGEMKEKIASLNLTDQQKAQIKTVADKYRPAIEPLAKEFFAERRALEALVHADTVDDAAIKAQASKVASAGSDLAVQSAHAMSELRAVLTPEQIQRINEGKGNRRVDRLLFMLAKSLGKS